MQNPAVGWLITLSVLLLVSTGCLRREEMQLVYAQRCLGCHGTSGRGNGPVAASLPVGIPNFRDTVKEKSVIQIRRTIREGKGLMPAFGPALEKYQIQDMVRFVRILSMEGRNVEWWERFEPLVWAHCSVPWQVVFDNDGPQDRSGS